jgi:predicted dinucleotide-binding enzyme
VNLGTRDASKLSAWAAEHSKIAIKSPLEVATWADLVIIAVKGTVAKEVAVGLAAALKGKTVIDCNNPIADAPPDSGILRYFTGPNESLLEILQAAVPEAHFVKRARRGQRSGCKGPWP